MFKEHPDEDPNQAADGQTQDRGSVTREPHRSDEVIVVDGKPPGVARFGIYCDESGISGTHPHYGFGALIMQYQRRGEFVAAIEEIRAKHRYGSQEIKWNHAAAATSALYREIVDYFFRMPWLRFHAMVVERAWVDVRQYHNGSYDLARRKHFTKLLSNKVAGIVKMNPGRDLDFMVFADPIASSYKKAGEAVEIIGNRAIQKDLTLINVASSVKHIRRVIEVDSKERDEVQLCDLLLGAVVEAWNDRATSKHKVALKKHVASYLGWADLRSDTRPKERKFNVWWLTDEYKSGERPVKTREVHLRYPLPPHRQYRTPRGR